MPTPKHPLFPKGVDEAVADLNTKLNYMTEHKTRLGVPQEEITKIRINVETVNDAYDKARDKDTRSKFDIATRNETIETAETSIRKVINFYVVGNPEVTAKDYEMLRIPTGEHHPLHVPDYAPGVRSIISKELGLEISIVDTKTNNVAKPEGVYSIEVHMQLGGTRPTDAEEMKERRVSTSAEIHLQFTPADENKIVYLAFRWLGTRGDYGIWSTIYEKTIIR
jgi:hypothetical protein